MKLNPPSPKKCRTRQSSAQTNGCSHYLVACSLTTCSRKWPSRVLHGDRLLNPSLLFSQSNVVFVERHASVVSPTRRKAELPVSLPCHDRHRSRDHVGQGSSGLRRLLHADCLLRCPILLLTFTPRKHDCHALGVIMMPMAYGRRAPSQHWATTHNVTVAMNPGTQSPLGSEK